MGQEFPKSLPHVLWIGGATDSGKSSVAQKLAERRRLQIYSYDRRDLAHHEQLAKTHPQYAAFLQASLEERWVMPEPEELFRRMLQSAIDRFPLVIADLITLPREPKIVAEGFGLLPEFLAPLLLSPNQAVWLAPTEGFKRDSMNRRGKPSFGAQVTDPQRAKSNLIMRDHLFGKYIREQVLKYGYTLYDVDGTRSVTEMVAQVEQHFASFF